MVSRLVCVFLAHRPCADERVDQLWQEKRPSALASGQVQFIGAFCLFY